jgi:hypothetical protein
MAPRSSGVKSAFRCFARGDFEEGLRRLDEHQLWHDSRLDLDGPFQLGFPGRAVRGWGEELLVASLLKRCAIRSRSRITVGASSEVRSVLKDDTAFVLAEVDHAGPLRPPFAVLRSTLIGDLLGRSFLPIDHRRFQSNRSFSERLMPKVGIIWASVENGQCVPQKSVPLERMADALAKTNWTLVSIQRDLRAANADGHLDRMGIAAVGGDVAEANGPDAVDELLATLGGLDRIVTVSTTTAHLAAALGMQVDLIVAERDGQQWFWEVQARRDRRIYPTVRIHMGRTDRDPRWWEGSFESLEESIAAN